VGLTILNALFLVESWRDGASFDRTLTLGRLDRFITPSDLRRVARLLPGDSAFVQSVRRGEAPRYMDDLFTAMGAQSVDAVDASNFEGAAISHDLNEPLAPHLHSRYDAVIDGGTLEHIFNVPVACKSVMEALKVGGHFFATLPANNNCGHGFYQFSADFFYRAFSPENGFEIVKLLVAPIYAARRWLDGPVFKVLDPAVLKSRVEIKSRKETVFLVQARKVKQVAVFASWPQQSDYAAAWSSQKSGTAKDGGLAGDASAVRLWFRLTDRLGGAYRILEKVTEQRMWARQCLRNPALKPYAWKE
jgi:hypothetical protein